MKTAEVRDGAFNFTSWETTYFDADWTKHIHRVLAHPTSFASLLTDHSFTNCSLISTSSSMVVTNLACFSTIAKPVRWTVLSIEPTRYLGNTPLLRRSCSKTGRSVYFLINLQASRPLPMMPALVTTHHSVSLKDSFCFIVLIHSSSADYTTDLLPILSQTRISPCYADILVPSEVSCLSRSR